MKLGEIITSEPTLGFNCETIEYRNMSFTIWVSIIELRLTINGLDERCVVLPEVYVEFNLNRMWQDRTKFDAVGDTSMQALKV